MNACHFVGRIVNVPSRKEIQRNGPRVQFVIATHRRGTKSTDEVNADFPMCVAFGKTAEFILNYFSKGSWIEVDAEYRSGKYEKNGETVYTHNFVVNNAGFVGDKSSGQSSNNNVDDLFSDDSEEFSDDDYPF
jgi:single-strand DNA-binding protein